MADWFQENAPTVGSAPLSATAPQAAAAPPTGADWFTQNAPVVSPWEKAGKAFVEGLGVQTLMDILGATSRDPKRIAKGSETLKAVGKGLLAEPGRVMGELGQTVQSLWNMGSRFGEGDFAKSKQELANTMY